MQKRFYLPTNEYYRWKWYMNLAAKLPDFTELLGIPRATVDAIVTNSLALFSSEKTLYHGAKLNKHP